MTGTSASRSRASGGHDWTIDEISPAGKVQLAQRLVWLRFKDLNTVMADPDIDPCTRDAANENLITAVRELVTAWEEERNSHGETLSGDKAQYAQERIRRPGAKLPD